MNLADLQNGDKVFIDANIFIYHFGGKSSECKLFLERCARLEILGFTSTTVLTEVLHRLMVAEAIHKNLTTKKNVIKKLSNKPDVVKQLSDYQHNVNKISLMNITILDLTAKIVEESSIIRLKEGLLTNDSIILSQMQNEGITKLVTANGDFDRVGGIETYKPNDLGS